QIGVYTINNVRGFSPTTAGNLRIDGLYFDQAGELNRRLTDRSTIRVGIAAQSYPFPAPTGIVDYRLRIPGSKLAASGSAGFADYFGPYFDVDLQIPLAREKLGVVVGFGAKDDEFPDGSHSHNKTIALLVDSRPFTNVRLRSFWTQMIERDVEAQPVLAIGGDWLPPQVRLRKYIGQTWESNEHLITNGGLLADIDLAPGWTIRGGVFGSTVSDASNYADLFLNVQPDGSAEHRIVADPREGTRSTSGELRLSRIMEDGPRKHMILAIVRGRQRDATFGGSDPVDLGQVNVLVPKPVAKPLFGFTDPNGDSVRQLTAGIAYEGYWKDVGQIGIGVQKTRYRKVFTEPGSAPARSSDSPLLFYGTFEAKLSRRLAVFAGMTHGLEETGVAPDNASNRGQALPAARTRQVDGGVSYAPTKSLQLVAAAFDVQKPYFNLNSKNIYTALGNERHRGIEISATGAVTPRLNVVAGAVLLDARVTGQAVSEGRIGKRPVNSTPHIVRVSAEYFVPGLNGLSLDFGVDHDGRRVASPDNAIRLPARTIFRAGVRYRFHIDRTHAQFRLLVDNITDHFSWALTNGGGFKVDVGRRVTGYLALDF
ncbi:MAG TPA: TonB-dependent receptor, partial [Sphingomicrobium sp.]|nr:TonB-dependent receptor [Sphingomicrobium sp.]